LAIKQYIEAKIRKYLRSNDDLVIALMERIEIKYPKHANYDLDAKTPFYAREISSFRLDYPKDKDAPIKFLYSYLCFLSHYDDEVEKIAGVGTKQLLKGHSDKISFKISGQYERNLLLLAKTLTANFAFVLERDSDDVIRKFVDILLAEDIRKLDPEKYMVQFGCGPLLVRHIFNNIIDTYQPVKEFDTVVDLCGLFFNKDSDEITRGALYTQKNRLKKSGRLKWMIAIDKIFNECSPH